MSREIDYTELAAELEAPVTVDEFRTLNRCLDDAIADAVTAFATGHDDAISDHAESVRRRVFLVNEQRRLITTAIQTLTAIKSGNAGLAGANGTVLVKALIELRDLIDEPAPEILRASEADLRGFFGADVAATQGGHYRRNRINPARRQECCNQAGRSLF